MLVTTQDRPTLLTDICAWWREILSFLLLVAIFMFDHWLIGVDSRTHDDPVGFGVMLGIRDVFIPVGFYALLKLIQRYTSSRELKQERIVVDLSKTLTLDQLYTLRIPTDPKGRQQ